MENMDFLPQTAPSLDFTRETYLAYTIENTLHSPVTLLPLESIIAIVIVIVAIQCSHQSYHLLVVFKRDSCPGNSSVSCFVFSSLMLTRTFISDAIVYDDDPPGGCF